MINPKRDWLILFVLIYCQTLNAGTEASANAKRQGPTTDQLLAKLMPLPDDVPRTIMNPYYAQPGWKLWALDPSPVTIDKPHFKGTFQLPTAARRYPSFFKRDSTELILGPPDQSQMAGFWDDCYMSLDSHHTRLLKPKDQFIDGGKMRTARDVQTLLELGVNFTSQSYSDRGRAIVDDIFNNLNTERHFFFANCIRATPSHASYEDRDEDRVRDLYDGLFAHSYHSLGQSGSEVNALYKMMVAGACMPRSTKDLLKKHGAYAIALLTIFKAALPYADAQGRALPFEHELRQRPVYSSNGIPSHSHYCPANVHYHAYDEKRHLRGMMDMARELVSAPPVAVARLLSFTVKKDGKTISDKTRLAKRIKCISLTNMRFWGEKNDILEVRIDLNRSYDLQHRKLSFKCLALYPNQKNVSIREEAPGIFLIRVKHDPKMPKGRIPVICTANNGLIVPSNPVFINFYWPDEKEVDDYFPIRGLPEDARLKIEALGLKRLPVTVNQRPIVDFGFVGDALRCLPGQTISVDLKAHDPEGFPVTVFRRSDEIGTIKQGRFTANIPATDQNKIYRVHFIFSDGTGGYTGKQLKLLVAKQTDTLPVGWAVTTLGEVQSAVKVSYDSGTFTFSKQPLGKKTNYMQGTFVFQPVSKTSDLMCRIPTIGAATDMTLMITNTLDGFSRQVGIGLFRGKISGVIKSRERYRTDPTYQWSGKHSDKLAFFRLIMRDRVVAAYISANAKTWEQVMVGKITFFRQPYAGLIYRGTPWTLGNCEWLLPPGPALPMLTTGAKSPDRENMYDGPLEVTITSPDQNTKLRYTIDGSDPTAQSQMYESPIMLTQAGRHEIRVKAFRDKPSQETAVAIYHLKPVTEKP